MYLAILLIILAKFPIQPYISAGIYTVANFLMLLMFGSSPLQLIVSTIVGFIAAFVYFAILRQLDRSIVGWFLFAVFGAIVVTIL